MHTLLTIQTLGWKVGGARQGTNKSGFSVKYGRGDGVGEVGKGKHVLQ